MGRRTRKRENRPQAVPQNRKRIIAGIIAISLVAAGILIAISARSGARQLIQRPGAQGMTMGESNAPVKVEEYSDFQCPFCGEFARDYEPEIVEKYIATGKVQFTYIPFSFIGPESIKAAEAAYCAADQNKFWEFHDILFNNQGGENVGVFSDASLIRLAQRAGLTMNQFRACFDNRTHQAQVESDFTNAQSRGVTGTPTFFVNGEGPVDMRSLDDAIQQALDPQN